MYLMLIDNNCNNFNKHIKLFLVLTTATSLYFKPYQVAIAGIQSKVQSIQWVFNSALSTNNIINDH